MNDGWTIYLLGYVLASAIVVSMFYHQNENQHEVLEAKIIAIQVTACAAHMPDYVSEKARLWACRNTIEFLDGPE